MLAKKLKSESGSVTVEATISLSAFMFAIVTLLTIVNVCIVQARMSYASTYVQAVRKYYECYQKVLHAFYFMEDDAEKTKEKLWGNSSKTYGEYYEELSNQFATYAAVFNDDHSAINSELDKFENTIGNKTATETTNTTIVDIYTKICGYRSTLVNAKTQMEKAKTYWVMC